MHCGNSCAGRRGGELQDFFLPRAPPFARMQHDIETARD